ncbi:MAG: ribonuclease H-like domain-containing protein [Anaerolineae bacterium]|nr:ribonuclease H-like domain-containing protein [Anaerolineae bacterium]
MEATLRERLRRLGMQKGTSHLKAAAKPAPAVPPMPPVVGAAAPQPSASPASAQHQLWNIEQPTPYGMARIRRTVYDLSHLHGDRPLAHALERPLDQQHFANALFLDTETTGLAGGAGTLAFLVGVGYFTEVESWELRVESGQSPNPQLSTLNSQLSTPNFVVDQFFLSDPAEEAAMLLCIDKLVNTHDNVVTFNGKTFDVPLLETRFTLSRIAPSFADKPHVDLLHYARRAWRGMLSSLSLGSLEFHLLGVRRDQQDIAGFLIPQLYRDYLQAGAAAAHEEMSRVLYHNLHDILSMVTLAARLHDVFARPSTPDEYLAVGRHHERNGDWAQAVEAYKEAEDQPNPQPSQEAQRRLANGLKRLGRRDEAVVYWEALADADDIEALIELAKHYEWHAVDHTRALLAAKRAQRLARDPITRREIEQRVERIKKKLA